MINAVIFDDKTAVLFYRDLRPQSSSLLSAEIICQDERDHVFAHVQNYKHVAQKIIVRMYLLLLFHRVEIF